MNAPDAMTGLTQQQALHRLVEILADKVASQLIEKQRQLERNSQSLPKSRELDSGHTSPEGES